MVTFQRAHVEAAGMLLSARHAEEREKTPSLPKLFEEPLHTRQVIDALLEKENVSGVAAFRYGTLIPVLLGPQENRKFESAP